MYPLSFQEYLQANRENSLIDILRESSPTNPLPHPFHFRLIEHLRIFMITGGMPEVVDNYIQYQDLNRTVTLLDSLINNLDDDFAKYKALVPVSRLREVFKSVASQTGNKFKYSKVSLEDNHRQIKEAVELLERAGLVYRVFHTHANGIPLGSELDSKKFKMILFDHGIHQRIMGLDIKKLILPKDYSSIYKGSLAEQFTGVELVKYHSSLLRPSLYYWHREKSGSMAEVDYLVQKDEKIIPIEVKAGGRGKMQSLRLFLSSKKADFGVRIALENFSTYEDVRVYPVYGIYNLIYNPTNS
ncbi:MAG: DUF4143 domain-containing protein [Bacteroidetes bacterium]|nr:DUF4143 domain-containing protein [Bacteroidota bacterium]